MPDISMCANQTCPKKESCYRFTAKPCKYQTYADFKPDEEGKCEYYWENEATK